MTACPGVCNRLYRAQQADDPAAVLPWQGEPMWCLWCTGRIRGALNAFPQLYAHLELDKLHATKAPSGDNITGSRDRPSPSAAADEQDNALAFVLSWEDTIRDLRDMPHRTVRLAPVPDRCPVPRQPRSVELMRATRESTTFAAACRFLTVHIGWALADERIAVDLGQEILTEVRRLRLWTHTDEQRRRMSVPCPRCDTKALVHEGGSDYMTCANAECGRIVSMDEYEELEKETPAQREARIACDRAPGT